MRRCKPSVEELLGPNQVYVKTHVPQRAVSPSPVPLPSGRVGKDWRREKGPAMGRRNGHWDHAHASVATAADFS